jgi:hypothetical protein
VIDQPPPGSSNVSMGADWPIRSVRKVAVRQNGQPASDKQRRGVTIQALFNLIDLHAGGHSDS